MMAATKILVVEDEAIVAESIRIKLKKMGYSVISTASSADEAIRKTWEYLPDLVLMDIVLQGEMDGIEAAGQIHTLFDIPVVYLTAYSDEKTLLRAKITEPFGYIIKPFKERELHVAIEISLFKHDMEKKLKERNKWFSVTLNSISDGVIATDSKGCVIFMNTVAQSMTGWELDMAEGKPLKEVLNIVSEKIGPVNENLLQAEDGTRIPIDISTNSIKDDKGNILGVAMVFRCLEPRKVPK
ncbi:MAG: response regulator [Candidatus Methanoperedens sp.]|nr:response regulator [Candidatus Methanoperedens sp.]